MPESRIAELTARTRTYLASPKGKRAWRENRNAHGFSCQKNLVAAIQCANPRSRVVRLEDLVGIMEALGGRGNRMSGPVAFLARKDGALEARAPLVTCDACDLAEFCGPEYPCTEDWARFAEKQIEDYKP